MVGLFKLLNFSTCSTFQIAQLFKSLNFSNCSTFQIAQSPFAPSAKLAGALKSLPLGAVIWEGPARAGRGREFYRFLLRRNADFFYKILVCGLPKYVKCDASQWWFSGFLSSWHNTVLETFQKGGAEKRYLSITENIGKQYLEPQNLGEFDRPIEMLCGQFNKSKMTFCRQRTIYCQRKGTIAWHKTTAA